MYLANRLVDRRTIMIPFQLVMKFLRTHWAPVQKSAGTLEFPESSRFINKQCYGEKAVCVNHDEDADKIRAMRNQGRAQETLG